MSLGAVGRFAPHLSLASWRQLVVVVPSRLSLEFMQEWLLRNPGFRPTQMLGIAKTNLEHYILFIIIIMYKNNFKKSSDLVTFNEFELYL
jgi:hypothetical protein